MRARLAIGVMIGGIAIVGLASMVWNRVESVLEDEPVDPAVKILLSEFAKNDPDHKSRFFTTLATLAAKHGGSLKDYVPGWSIVDEGYAVRIRTNQRGYVVLVLRGDDFFTPGTDRQHLLLLNPDGRLLDTLVCGINNRLTRMFVDHSGIYRTDVPSVPQKDGAQLVIRFIPAGGGSVSGNWSHEITHAGASHTFHWNQDRADAIRSEELDMQGLCRVAIRDGRFVVLFPKLGD